MPLAGDLPGHRHRGPGDEIQFANGYAGWHRFQASLPAITGGDFAGVSAGRGHAGITRCAQR